MLSPDSTVRGRYRIIYAVDERPDARIYRARDDESGRLVLLGAFPLAGGSANDFALAARQLAAVQHESLLALRDHFAEGESYYYVSDDTGGQDLERVLRSNGPLAEDPALPQAVQLLGAVELLHQQRPPFYFGDPRLSDIWVTDQGAWRLAPFTLVRPIGGEPSPYRAPELLSADLEPSPTTDTFAFAALLYHALSGWAPPTDEQIRAGTPLNSPRALNPNLSTLMEQALLRGLQPKPENRYQNAREMRIALDTIRMIGSRPLGTVPEIGAPPVEPPTVAQPQNYQPQSAYQPPQPAPQQPLPPPQSYAPPPPAYPPGAMPMPAGPQGQPYPIYAAPQRRGISTGCLAAIAVVLLLMAIGIALAFWLLLPSLRGFVTGSPFATIAPQVTANAEAPTAPPQATAAPEAAAPQAPQPTLEPANLGPNAITLQNAGTITRTREITNEAVGPLAFSPDGSQIAIGMTDRISLLPADMSSTGSRLDGHQTPVFALAWSPDGKQLASAAVNDSTIRVWNVADGKLARELTGHTGWIRGLAWSPDGKTLASASVDESIRLWDAANGTQLHELRGHTGIVSAIAFSLDSARLASTSRDGSVRMWDVAGGQEVSGFSFALPLNPNDNGRYWTTAVVFAPDGKQLAVGGTDQKIHLLDPATGQQQREIQAHEAWIGIRGLAYTPDGKRLISAAFDGALRIWNPTDGQRLAELNGHRLQIAGISVSPDGKRLASSSDEEGNVILWDLTSDQQIGNLRVGRGLATDLTFAPDSSMLGAAGSNGTLQIYQLDRQRGQYLVGSKAAAQPMAFVKSGQIATIADDGSINILSAGNTPPRTLTGLADPPLSVAASRDGSLIAAGSRGGAIALWGANGDQPKQTLQSNLKTIYRLAFSSDGSLLAVAGVDNDAKVEIWDLASGQVLQTIGNLTGVRAMSFQPRGGLLALTDLDGTVRVYRGKDGTPIRTITPTPQQGRFTSMAFAPDGTMIAAGTIAGNLVFLDAGSGKTVSQVQINQGAPFALAFSPDGQQLAASIRNEETPVYIFELPKR